MRQYNAGTTSATAISNSRLLVVMGDASSLELVEEYASGPTPNTKYFSNTVTEVQLDEGAELKHGWVQAPHMSLSHLLSLPCLSTLLFGFAC